ncbi:MAG TPA: hypothetical protein VF602_08525 [Pedobacter sp.]|jgi:hypothetical protein
MRKELFQPTFETEARLLLLINAFSSPVKSLDGRTKLTKLDFFLRYPGYLKRGLEIRNPDIQIEVRDEEVINIEAKMIRYRYGPWDPSYFAVLGRLIGKGLIQIIPSSRGIGYRTTEEGKQLSKKISSDENWQEVALRIKLLKRHFDLSGSSLMKFIYEHFPEVAGASWGDKL